MEGVEKKRKFKIPSPNVYALLMVIIILCAVLTYIIPAGNYDMITMDDGREVVDPATFHYVDKTPVGPMAALAAVFDGFVNGGEIIFLIFITGGAMAVVFATGAVQAGVVRLVLALSGKERIILPFLTLFFMLMGMQGSAEDLIIYVPIVVSLIMAAGFDSLTGVAVVVMGAGAGWIGSPMNLYTEGVAQGIAGLPIFSGAGFRIAIAITMFVITLVYLWIYAGKVKKTPEKSPVYELDKNREDALSLDLDDHPFGPVQAIIVVLFIGTIILMVVGVLKLGWWYGQICAIWLLASIICAILSRFKVNQWGEEFATGMTNIATGALVVGMARGILIVLQNGNIIHTMLHGASNVLNGMPKAVSAEGMYIFQCLCNFIIPSGSGQAAVTMPLMAPLADICGITRQTACIAYQIGDGLTNTWTPTSGYFMACLAMAKVPWDRWVRAMTWLVLIEFVVGGVFVGIAAATNLGPF